MRRAIANISSNFEIVLVDGNKKIKEYEGQQLNIVKGDSLCFCIAAASILAKSARDSFMQEASKNYPFYNFETNVGYGTKAHLEALDKFGICDLHRRNFAPIRDSFS